MAVTPVRTGPWPTTSFPSPLMSVVMPTATPGISVMALQGPGSPGNGSPSPRPRLLPDGVAIQAGWIMFSPLLISMMPFLPLPHAAHWQKHRGTRMANDTVAHYREFLIILGVAGVVVPFLLRLGISTVLGFLLVGILLGPDILGRLVASFPSLDALL